VLSPVEVRLPSHGRQSSLAEKGNTARPISQQPTLIARVKAPIGEAREMQYRPESIASVGKVMSVCGSTLCRVKATEYDIEVSREDV
jgi:hypothetical protein